jgi:hypothetical protein
LVEVKLTFDDSALKRQKKKKDYIEMQSKKQQKNQVIVFHFASHQLKINVKIRRNKCHC